MATKNGMIKKTSLEEFENVRRTGIIAIGLKDNDELGWVKETDGKQDVMLFKKHGMLIRFSEKNVRPMGRTAAGVRGVRFKKKDDKVVSMDIVDEKADLIAISNNGYGKRMAIKDFRRQNRGGTGITAIKLRSGDEVARARFIEEDDELLFVTANGTISRQNAKGISRQGRYAKGVIIQRLEKGDYIVDVARVAKKEEETK